MDDNNLIADLQQLDNIRERILKDNGLLIRAIRVWDELTCTLIMHDPLFWQGDGRPKSFDEAVPFVEYAGLTTSLAYWCDITPLCRIDPTALTDLVCYMQDVDLMLLDGLTPEQVKAEVSRRDFNELMGRAFNLTGRIMVVAMTSQDHKMTPQKKAGRRAGSIGESHKAIRKELAEGTHHRDVAEQFLRTTSWVLKIHKALDNTIREKLTAGESLTGVAKELDIEVEYVNRINKEMISESS